MSPPGVIRPARPGDADAVLDLWEALMANGAAADPRYRPTPDARDPMGRWAATAWFGPPDPFPGAWVAEGDAGLLGFVSVHASRRLPVIEGHAAAVIGDLYVRPDARGQGIGRALVESALQRARAAGYPQAQVSTLVRDARAVDFWRALGFGELTVTLTRGSASSAGPSC